MEELLLKEVSANLIMLYAYLESPLGLLQITEIADCINSVLFVNEKTKTETHTALLHKAKQQLIAYFDGELSDFDLPLSQDGISFQQSAWKNLQSITYGKIVSYSALSTLMQNKLAIRAIAATNGKYKIMIIVPCHRLIGLNGTMTGYA